jgi:hypothetical protein
MQEIECRDPVTHEAFLKTRTELNKALKNLVTLASFGIYKMSDKERAEVFPEMNRSLERVLKFCDLYRCPCYAEKGGFFVLAASNTEESQNQVARSSLFVSETDEKIQNITIMYPPKEADPNVMPSE